jgi:hypothetical protein
MKAIPLSVGTANTIVRNVGVYFATDEALLHEARSQDHFIESDEQLLSKLRAAQKRLQGASRGGSHAAAKKRQNKEFDAAVMEHLRKKIRAIATHSKPFAGDEEWGRIIEKRVTEAKTPLDLADLQRDLARTSKRHQGENS